MRWPRLRPPPSTPLLPPFPPKKRNPKLASWRVTPRQISRLVTSNKRYRLLILICVLALFPPVFFHLRLRSFHKEQFRKCGWIENPPLVCAHGGDSTRATPNTMEAYKIALESRVDCMEVDVSRTLDGFLVALHDRDLQRISRNQTAKAGHFTFHQLREINAQIPLVENVLELISKSLRQVILDVKVGPPLYENNLANHILSIVKTTKCRNCAIWAKSDTISRDIIKLAQDIMVGYIIMKDFSTGTISKLGRVKGAQIGGVYHPLIDEKLVKALHRKREKVYAWTVDDEDSLRRMLLEKVDGIVTSNPSFLQFIMQDLRNECAEQGYSLP